MDRDGTEGISDKPGVVGDRNVNATQIIYEKASIAYTVAVSKA